MPGTDEPVVVRAPGEAGATAPRVRLRTRVASSAALSLGGQVGSQLLRLAGNLVLARLLSPQAFGVMAIVTLWMIALEMFSNLGIQPAIVRHSRGSEPDFLDTAFTLQAVRGFLVWGVGIASAVPLARFYELPELVTLIPVATFASVIMGFYSTKLVTQTRNLTLTPVVVNELAGQALGLLAMMAIAFAYRSVWALVIGGLVNAAVRMVLSHVAIPGRMNRFRWEKESARDLIEFGRWIFVSTLFGFIASRVDVAILGKLVPIAGLGVYSIAIQLPTMVRDVAGRLIQSVLMPALADSYRAGPAAMAYGFERAQRLLLPLTLFCVGSTAVLAPSFFQFLYDDRYHAASWMAQLAMVALWFAILNDSVSRALLALGDSRSIAVSSVARAIATAGGCLIGYSIGAVPGLILGGAAGGLCGYAVVAYQLSEVGLSTIRLDLLHSIAGITVGALVCGTPWFVLGPASTGREIAMATLLLGALVLVPYGIYVARLAHRELRRA